MRVLPHRVVGRRHDAGKDEAWAGKENAANPAPSAPQPQKLPSSKPIYLSTQPGPGPARIEPVVGRAPLQGSRFGSVTLEPLTPRVGYFCPEIHSLPEHQCGRCPDSTLSSTALCQELKELSAILDRDAVEALSQATLAPALHGREARAASIPKGIEHSSAMRLSIDNLTFRDRIGEPGSQGGEVLAALYRDAETLIEHEVAVKRLPAASTPEQLAALEHEAHVMSLVSSRCHNCVRYWGWCQAEDSAICLVMKRYEQSLDAKLKSLPGLKLPRDHVQRYSKQIAQALSELHSQNVLHLDLKPSNILLDQFDNIAVCDFGISQRPGSQREPNSSNGVFGSFNYMSPEAFDQIAYGAVSTKSDVWSFACVFVEMVSGCRPWKDTSMAAICYKVASNKQIPEIPKMLPSPIQQMLLRCFEHDSNLRPTFADIHRVLDQDWNRMDAPMLPPRPIVSALAKKSNSAESNIVDTKVVAVQSAAVQLPSSNVQVECKDEDREGLRERPRVPSVPKFKDKTVRLCTYDQQIVDIPFSVAKRSATLRWQMDLQEENVSVPISLEDPSCTATMIHKVFNTYLHTLQEAEQGLKDVAELRNVETSLIEVDEDGIFALLMVANYLDLPELTYLACSSLKPHMEEKNARVPQHLDFAGELGAQNAARLPNVRALGLKSNLRTPELPPRKHRFDRAASPTAITKPRPTRSRSSPAKPHQLDEAKIYDTGKVVSEADMRRMIPGYRTPVKKDFLPGVGLIDSIADWGKSSWSDLVQPRFAMAAIPTSPACRNSKPPGEKPGVGSERLVPDSIHCTPFINRANCSRTGNPLGALSTGMAKDDSTPEAGTSTPKGACLSETLFRLEFRRMIHPDGDRYVGTTRGDLMHGIGICWYANGDKYYGQWRAGMRHGTGRMEWNDSHIYEGTWREDIVCPGVKSKRLNKENLGIGRKPAPPSPHPLAYRPPMSVHMFRARLSRMQGIDKPSPDALECLMEKNGKDAQAAIAREKAEAPAQAADTRGILTHVVHQTQSVAGVFSGMGDFVSAIISQSPPHKSTSNGDDAGNRTARLRYFRLDKGDKLVEEEYFNLMGTTPPEWAPPSQSTKSDGSTGPVDVYWIF